MEKYKQKHINLYIPEAAIINILIYFYSTFFYEYFYKSSHFNVVLDLFFFSLV